MKDLSMHILDIAENSTRAGAIRVSIRIVEDTKSNIMSITISDDGKGMNREELDRALDPFFSTKQERKKSVGLGLPMMKKTAEMCGGRFEIESEKGKGTAITAVMQLDHIDRPPMGDLNETLAVLIAGNPEVEIEVRYITDGEEEYFSTRGDGADAA